ncbi:FitA-like ribbon-helix-helix domain-containing protein [Rhizobium tropici]|uniref:FitA-like ribbon-helix-helix domain-containing protein n=1 Tax=Rhizobium tropici TaxID=398 RepID=UPI003D7C1FF3
METCTCANLDNELISKLKVRAARHGRSAEAERSGTLRNPAAGRGKRGRAEFRRTRGRFAEADCIPQADAL